MRSSPTSRLLSGSVVRLAGASAATLLLRAWLPLPADDALRGTLLLLPALLAVASEIAHRAERQGGKPLSWPGTAGELGALGLLFLLTLGRSHLGVPYADLVLAAGFLVLLGHRLLRQTVALRPLLGDRLPDRPSLLFFLLPLFAYLAILPWSANQRQPDGDEPYNLLIAHSLAYDGDADLTNNYAQGDWRFFMNRPLAPQPGDPVGPRGELYSRHNEVVPLFLAPAYRLAGKAGALAMMAALAAALAWLTLRLGRHYARDRPGETLAAWAVVAFTPPMLLYSGQLWVEVPSAVLVVIALDRILSARAAPIGELDNAKDRWERRDWLAIGLPVLLLPLVKIRLVLLSGPLLALAWWYGGRKKKQILLLGALLSVLGIGILVYNQLLYSNPLKIHTWQEVEPYQHSLASYALGFSGLFWDAAFGLFACAPIWLLVVPAAFLLLARRQWALLAHAGTLALPYLMVVAPRTEWYGGWSPPFRYGLVMLPLLALALVPLFAERRRAGARALLVALAAATVALTVIWIAMPGWTYNFADGRTYLLDHLSERLGRDATRLFPSSIRPRAATWVWPLATALLLPLVWWWPVGTRPDQRSRTKGTAGLLGIATLLALAALVPVAARRLTTTVVEIEDPQVTKSGGHLFPDPWVIERPLYRGGWVLRVEEKAEIPVTPGGPRVRLHLAAQLIRNQPVPYWLEVRAGDRLLAVWSPRRSRTWEEIGLGPFDWPAGKPLVLAAHGDHPPGELNGAILDRVRFEWVR